MRYKIILLLMIFIPAGLLTFHSCKEDEMEVPEASSIADFTYSSDNEFTAPTTISFTNKSIKAQSYAWDFGNGETSTMENPSVTYEASGIYDVVLSIEPENQVYYNETEKSVEIVIKDPEAAALKTLYYTSRETGKGHYVVLDTIDPVIQDFPTGGFYKPYGIAIDYKNEKVYISDTDGFIFRYDLNGENQEVILSEENEPMLDAPYGLVVVEDKIYWSRMGGIYRCNLDGSNPEPFAEFSGAPELPLGMAYDSIQQKIFFVNDKYEFSGGVYTINMDGSGLTEIISGVDAGDIALDLINGKLYYADWVGGVFMANIDGSEVVNINPNFDNIFVWGIAVDPEAGYLYVSDKENLMLIRSDLDGSNPVGWLTEVEPYALAIDIPR